MADCTPPDLSKLTDNQSFIDTDQLLATDVAAIGDQLGLAWAVEAGALFIPLAPFVWLAFEIPDLISMFSGRPKDQDTLAVVDAYNQSAYWPLHSLATNLSVALKNGAPISDSNPTVQATFSQWKQGTIESIQQLAGFQPGAQSPGYWQLQQLINASWVYSKGGENQVLNVVKAIDCFTEVLAGWYQYQKENPPPPAPPPAPSPGSGQSGDCPPYLTFPTCLPTEPPVDRSRDEVGNTHAQLEYWLSIAAMYLMNIFQLLSGGLAGSSGGGGNSDPVTCTQLRELSQKLIGAIEQIEITIPPATPCDLTPLVKAIEGGEPPENPTPPKPPTPPAAPAYTITDALADVDAALRALPYSVTTGTQ